MEPMGRFRLRGAPRPEITVCNYWWHLKNPAKARFSLVFLEYNMQNKL